MCTFGNNLAVFKYKNNFIDNDFKYWKFAVYNLFAVQKIIYFHTRIYLCTTWQLNLFSTKFTYINMLRVHNNSWTWPKVETSNGSGHMQTMVEIKLAFTLSPMSKYSCIHLPWHWGLNNAEPLKKLLWLTKIKTLYSKKFSWGSIFFYIRDIWESANSKARQDKTLIFHNYFQNIS